ncbi:hypothetical protein PF008_g23294 [Phytophthora fragariae]|uniref:Uncharacterized protein n=1 Tax=Phytophthora fragariae TaxID=53985 RepID=A0A6G0QRE9_9STRA|nr:hypothetical protein PF008_g23294 [Phytophthora fragariae]
MHPARCSPRAFSSPVAAALSGAPVTTVELPTSSEHRVCRFSSRAFPCEISMEMSLSSSRMGSLAVSHGESCRCRTRSMASTATTTSSSSR